MDEHLASLENTRSHNASREERAAQHMQAGAVFRQRLFHPVFQSPKFLTP